MRLSPSAPDHGDLRHYDAGRHRVLNLVRFMEQNRYLYRRKQAFLAHVQRKVHAGRYQADAAPALWAHWLKEGLRRYLRAHPRIDAAAFTTEFMQDLACEVAEREHTRIVRSDYVDMTVDGQIGSRGRMHVTRYVIGR
jgi:hypothetical protein